jgi:1-deoxy-D-xylulose-5-phosphate synthase
METACILDQIKKENDIKEIPREQWEELAEEIRRFLVEHVAKTGGHLASNLGVV